MAGHDQARRGSSRFRSSLPAVLLVGPVEHPCEAANIGRTGCLLLGPIRSRAGAEVRVRIRTTTGDREVEVPARVVWVDTDPGGVTSRVGVEFGELDDGPREELELMISRVVEGVAPAVFESIGERASPEEIRIVLDKVPLAHRVALARRALPREREILVHDPNPQVLESLARNPQLRPLEIRTMLRLPLLLPTTLQVLARDPRWRSSEELQMLIGAHHNAPMSLAEEIAGRLSPAFVRRMVQLPGLNGTLRRKLLHKHGIR